MNFSTIIFHQIDIKFINELVVIHFVFLYEVDDTMKDDDSDSSDVDFICKKSKHASKPKVKKQLPRQYDTRGLTERYRKTHILV